jgi:tRNA A-37 threonylcarbamoyl transferase component Bud32
MAYFAGQPVLAKLFVGRKAAKHFALEEAGARLLAQQSLPTPPLLESGFAPREKVGWLLFTYLANARTLAEQLADDTGFDTMLRATVAIAHLHAQGLWQEDLHPGNLLLQEEKFFWIDGGSIRAEEPGRPLSPARALDNYGMFLAQLPLRRMLAENALADALAVYQKANPACAIEMSALKKAVARQRRARLRDWLRKIGRTCSDFIRRQNGWRGAFGLTMIRREEADRLAPLLANPDAFIAQGEIYKDGGTATVARVTFEGRALIVKRYNIKNWRHRLSRCWRESRAYTSWREGNRMLALGLETARPLAMIEERWFWLRGRAWLILEHVAGENALNWLKTPEQQPEIKALQTLMAELAAARLSHGDMKGTNLIWQAESRRWALIDLDGMRAHRCGFFYQSAHRRDLRRLLQNWPEEGATGALRQTLVKLFTQA